jgi:hypothetical protein
MRTSATIQLVTMLLVTGRPMPGMRNNASAVWATPLCSEAATAERLVMNIDEKRSARVLNLGIG